MPVMDEFKEEREALKNGTPKEKLAYFWYYYKWHVIGTIIAIIAVASLIHNYVTQKDIALYTVVLNSADQYTSKEYAQKVAEHLAIDTQEYEVFFDTSMYIDFTKMDEVTTASTQKMMVYIAACELDCIVTDTASLQHYSYNDTFYDLREILSAEQLEKYEPYFYYIDRKVLEEKQAAYEAMDDTYIAEYPQDPSNPETMAEPVPVGIYVDKCDDFKDNFLFQKDDIVFSIFCNSPHLDLTLDYLDYVFEP